MSHTSKLLIMLGLALGILLPLAAHAQRAAAPRPCFVPAHPLVKKTPRIDVGGGETYHAWHLKEQMQAEGKLSAAPAERPITDLDVIVLLVDFEDQPMDSTRAYFETVIRYLEEIYDQQSDGQLDLSFTITDSVYRMPEDMAYYGLDDSIATREGQLIADAVKTADPDVDYNLYNTYMTFHAGVGQEADIAGNNDDGIWSVFFRQVDLAFWGPDRNPRGVPTADTTALGDSVFVTSMVLVPEAEAQDGYDFGIMGVVAHEFGHRFNIPDLYDTTAPEGSQFTESQGIGAFGLMGAGIWNENGHFPAEMCAWSKFFVGWIRPQVLFPEDGEQTITLEGIVHDRRGGAVRIPIGGDEYFLIENRMRDYNENGRFDFNDVDGDSVFTFGVDSYAGAELDWHLPQEPVNQKVGNLDGSGLLIWHVDESVLREHLFYNTVNADPDHKGLDLEEADGVQDLDNINISYEGFGDAKDAFFAPDATEFTPETTPSSHAHHGARTEVWITNIPEHGRFMTFDLAWGGFETGYPHTFAEGRVGDFQPVLFDADGDGLPDIVVPLQLENEARLEFVRGPLDTPTRYTYPTLRAEPIHAQIDDDSDPELAWATADGIWTLQPGGSPVQAATFDTDPGRFAMVAVDLDNDMLDELVVGSAKPDQDLIIYQNNGASFEPWIEALDWMDTSLPASAGTLRSGSALKALVVSARITRPDSSIGGRVVMLNSSPGSFSLGDSIAFSAPVVGDLDRDGQDDVVVAADDGFIYALTVQDNGPGASLQVMEGWPVFVEALAGDAVSLADFDNDGYLEVLAFGPVNAFYAINYNGVVDLELPATVPGENRFEAPFRAPMVADVDPRDGLELVLPLADGQVRGHRLNGSWLPGWAYQGGPGYPLLADFDDDGRLELATVEDITVSIPEDVVIVDGDLESDLMRRARVVMREVADFGGLGPWPAASGSTWPVYRGSNSRAGYAPPPEPMTTESPALQQLFVMPNPLTVGVGGFHYRVADTVTAVEITIFDITGQEIRTLEGTAFPGVDNLVPWDLRSDSGNDVAPGLYVARIRTQAPGETRTDMTKFSVLR